MVCLRESIYCASGRHHLCDGGQSPPASQLDGSICTCPCHLPVCEVQVTAIERVPDLEKIEVVWPAGGSNQLVFICASCAEKGERIVELEDRAEKAEAEVARLRERRDKRREQTLLELRAERLRSEAMAKHIADGRARQTPPIELHGDDATAAVRIVLEARAEKAEAALRLVFYARTASGMKIEDLVEDYIAEAAMAALRDTESG